MCTRAENFLRENRVIYKTELLKLIKQKRVHDCSGEPVRMHTHTHTHTHTGGPPPISHPPCQMCQVPMYFVELHNLSDQEKALPFAERYAWRTQKAAMPFSFCV